MRNFGSKNRWKYIMHSRPVLILLLLTLIVFAWSIFGFWGKLKETAKNKEIVENRIKELEEEKEKLSSDITKLKTDRGVEDTIRDKFGLAKEGEGLIVIVDNKDAVDAKVEDSGGFWSFLTRWFK